MKYKITIITENKPGVLYRIADLFLRRRINIESLAVEETDALSHLSRFIIQLGCDDNVISKILNQIKRIVEVRSAEYHKIDPSEARTEKGV